MDVSYILIHLVVSVRDTTILLQNLQPLSKNRFRTTTTVVDATSNTQEKIEDPERYASPFCCAVASNVDNGV